MEQTGSTRRSFVARLFGGSLIVGLTGVLASVVAFLFPPSEVRSGLGPRRTKVGGVNDLLPGDGKLILVDEEPVWVVRRGEKGVTAVSGLCTHKGCLVKWDGDRRVFRCPCHEGIFDEHGNVISGLPRRPLEQFPVGIVHGDVFVIPPERPVG